MATLVSDTMYSAALVLFISLTIIVITPILANYLRIPPLICLILAGVVFGPSLLGWLQLTVTIELLGTVGLLFTMALAGLDLDLYRFMQRARHSVIFGGLTFIIPQVIGTIVFLRVGLELSAAILVGSMFASHTLVAYPLVARLGITRDTAVTTTVGGTFVTNSLALLVLSVLAQAAGTGLDREFWAEIVIFTPIYIALVLFFVPRLGRWVLRHAANETRAAFVLVLTIITLCAALAPAFHVEPVLGAFLAGIGLNRLIPIRSTLKEHIGFYGEAFIIPFFLIYIGMLVNIRVLTDELSIWFIVVLMVLTNVGTKALAAFLTGHILRYSKAQRWIMCGLSCSEAAPTLAAALIGFQFGIIGEVILNSVLMTIFVTSLIGPFLVSYFGPQLAPQPGPDTSEKTSRILVPMSAKTSRQLIDIALTLQRGVLASVYPLNIISPAALHEIAQREEDTESIVRELQVSHPTIRPITRIDVSSAAAIKHAIVECQIDKMVLALDYHLVHDNEIATVDEILASTTLPTLVCHFRHAISTFGRIVVILPPALEWELKAVTKDALETLALLAQGLGTTLQLITTQSYLDSIQPELNGVLQHVQFETLGMQSWAALERILAIILLESDILVMLTARYGPLAWESGGDEFVEQVFEWFPELNIIMYYLEEPDESEV